MRVRPSFAVVNTSNSRKVRCACCQAHCLWQAETPVPLSHHVVHSPANFLTTPTDSTEQYAMPLANAGLSHDKSVAALWYITAGEAVGQASADSCCKDADLLEGSMGDLSNKQVSARLANNKSVLQEC